MAREKDVIKILAFLGVLVIVAMSQTSTFATANAPSTANFDRTLSYNYDGANTIWQYFPQYENWYVYHRDNPALSNLVLTEADWTFVLNGGVTKVNVTITDTQIQSPLGIGVIKAGETGGLVINLRNANDAGSGSATITILSTDSKTIITPNQTNATFIAGETIDRTIILQPKADQTGEANIRINVAGDESEPNAYQTNITYTIIGQDEPTNPPNSNDILLIIAIVVIAIAGGIYFTKKRR